MTGRSWVLPLDGSPTRYEFAVRWRHRGGRTGTRLFQSEGGARRHVAKLYSAEAVPSSLAFVAIERREVGQWETLHERGRR